MSGVSFARMRCVAVMSALFFLVLLCLSLLHHVFVPFAVRGQRFVLASASIAAGDDNAMVVMAPSGGALVFTVTVLVAALALMAILPCSHMVRYMLYCVLAFVFVPVLAMTVSDVPLDASLVWLMRVVCVLVPMAFLIDAYGDFRSTMFACYGMVWACMALTLLAVLVVRVSPPLVYVA